MNLARFGHKIQKPEALAGWLCAAALRSALAIAPRQRHQTASLNEGIASPERDPLDEISGRELIWVIEQELAVLPNEYRSAILLCGIEGLSIDEAAHRLGVTSGTLRGWLQRGELLKKRMSYRGLALPAALGAVFGLPATVSAATTTSTINAALAVAAGKPAYLTMFHWASKFVWLGALFAAAFLAWMVYRSLPELERQASPLEITKWELSTDAPLPPGAISGWETDVSLCSSGPSRSVSPKVEASLSPSAGTNCSPGMLARGSKSIAPRFRMSLEMYRPMANGSFNWETFTMR